MPDMLTYDAYRCRGIRREYSRSLRRRGESTVLFVSVRATRAAVEVLGGEFLLESLRNERCRVITIGGSRVST